MSKPPLPAALFAEADRLEQLARSKRVEAAGLDVMAAEYRAFAEKALRIGSNHGTVGSNVQLDLSDKSARVKNAGSRTRKGSAAKQRLLLSGHTDADLAKACKVGRSTVNAWMNGTRAIPPEHEKTAAKAPFNIPPPLWSKRA